MPHHPAAASHHARIAGLLLGTAVGDALGLPREGLSARRAARLFGPGPLRHAFLFRRGMYSDDTEHTCMAAQAWLAAGGDSERFARALAWRLRAWLLALPAGVGLATLRSILKLWLGFSPARSGVYSAGNGPAMRAAVLAACTPDPTALGALVRASTRLTHTDPRAEEGALVVARAAAVALRAGPATDPHATLAELRPGLTGPELLHALDLIHHGLTARWTVPDFAARLGVRTGVSGYINQTVPVALFCWLRTPTDFRTALESAILLGGDADTVGAITGGLAGAAVGESGIPADWIDGLFEYPRSTHWLRRLAQALAARTPSASSLAPTCSPDRAAFGHDPHRVPVPLIWPALLPRNALFAAVVLVHGLRRLLPPY